MSEAVRLQYLEQLLDATDRAGIHDKRERGIGVTFNEEWLRLEHDEIAGTYKSFRFTDVLSKQ